MADLDTGAVLAPGETGEIQARSPSAMAGYLPDEANALVYATSGYEQGVRNASQISLQSDNVFGDDGGIHQLATMSGDATGGSAAALTIGI